MFPIFQSTFVRVYALVFHTASVPLPFWHGFYSFSLPRFFFPSFPLFRHFDSSGASSRRPCTHNAHTEMKWVKKLKLFPQRLSRRRCPGITIQNAYVRTYILVKLSAPSIGIAPKHLSNVILGRNTVRFYQSWNCQYTRFMCHDGRRRLLRKKYRSEYSHWTVITLWSKMRK